MFFWFESWLSNFENYHLCHFLILICRNRSRKPSCQKFVQIRHPKVKNKDKNKDNLDETTDSEGYRHSKKTQKRSNFSALASFYRLHFVLKINQVPLLILIWYQGQLLSQPIILLYQYQLLSMLTKTQNKKSSTGCHCCSLAIQFSTSMLSDLRNPLYRQIRVCQRESHYHRLDCSQSSVLGWNWCVKVRNYTY